MTGGTSLIVQSGTLKAIGTAKAPIVLTSQKRQDNLAAAGDWKQLVFYAGTSTATRLEYLQVEYGKGVLVNGAAPTLNYVKLNNHQGAAMTLDLAASPAGVGNQAFGNDINAIVVPAGEISGAVSWGVRGIPYLVASGTLSVGVAPQITAIAPSSMQQGETQVISLSGTRLAGLSKVSFGLDGISTEVLAGGSDTQAQLRVTTDAAAVPGLSSLLAVTDAGEARLLQGLTVIRNQPKLGSVTPAVAWVGQGNLTIALKGQNFTNQAMVYLDSAALATTYASSTDLTAVVPNQSAAASHVITVHTPVAGGADFVSNQLAFSASVPALTLNPATASFVSGTTQDLTLALSYPAPAAGALVNLTSSVPSVASVPATLSFAAGESSKVLTVTGTGIGSSSITASRTGFSNAVSALTVTTPPLLSIDPATLSLGVGRDSVITVNSSAAAGSNGLSLALASSNPAVATVPATVTIPANQRSATVKVSPLALGVANVTAQAYGYTTGSTAVTVRPVSVVLPLGALVGPGSTRSIPLNLTDPAPAGGLLVSLASSNTAVLTVPASVTVPEGQSAATVTLSGVAAGTATLSASATGYQTGNSAVTIDTVTMSLGVSSMSFPLGVVNSYAVTLSRPAPTGGLTVALAMADPTIASVSPASITIAQGQTSGGVVKATVSALAEGSTSLLASAPGLADVKIAVTALPRAQLRLVNDYTNTNSATVGKGMTAPNYQPNLYRQVSGNAYAGADAVTVTLSSSDAGKVGVPVTVTIPAGAYSVSVPVSGLNLTGAVPVTINASAQGYTAPASAFTVNVVDPILSMSSLDGSRSVVNGRDDFSFNLSVTGGYGQVASADIAVDMAVVEASPADIIAGIYNSASGGVAVSKLYIRQGRADSYDPQIGWVYGYVGTPTAPGTYKVRATIAGGASATSAPQTVAAPQFKFINDYTGGAAVTVGTGMYGPNYSPSLYRQVNGVNIAGAEAVTVTLTSSDPSKVSVPLSITIPAGQASVSVPVAGVAATGATPVTLDASAPGYIAPAAKFPVTVLNPTITFNSLDGSRSVANGRDDFSLNLSVPGAYGNVASADIAVNVAIAEANPEGIVPGIYSAASGGAAVTQLFIRKDRADNYNPQVGWVYGYVGTPTGAGSYKVQATIAGSSSATSAVQTVTAPQFKFVNDYTGGTSVTVGKGMYGPNYSPSLYRQVNGVNMTGADAVTVSLTSSDPGKASVPLSITIPAGQASVSVPLAGVDVTGATPVTLDASAPGYSAPDVKFPVNVVYPTISINSLDGSRSVANGRDDFSINLSVAGGYGNVANADIPVNVAIVEASPDGIIPGIYNAATGGTTVSQLFIRKDRADNYNPQTGWMYGYVATPTGSGSYKVQATIAGSASATSAVQTVMAPQLRFYNDYTGGNSATVGKGMYGPNYSPSVYRQVNGVNFAGSEALTVSLACASTAVCNTPASITIPAGQASISVPVTGIEVGNTTISGAAAGYLPASDYPMNVVSPQLSFSNVPSSMAVGQSTNIQISVSVNGGYGNVAAQALPFSLSVSAPDVASAPQSGAIAANASYSGNLLLKALAPGQTTLTVSGPGLTQATSITITVTP